MLERLVELHAKCLSKNSPRGEGPLRTRVFGGIRLSIPRSVEMLRTLPRCGGTASSGSCKRSPNADRREDSLNLQSVREKSACLRAIKGILSVIAL
jgi:hypothetical protein